MCAMSSRMFMLVATMCTATCRPPQETGSNADAGGDGETEADLVDATDDGGALDCDRPSETYCEGGMRVVCDDQGRATRAACAGGCRDGECLDPCETAADEMASRGCEFWAVDLPNADVVTGGEVEQSPSDKQFAVVVSNPLPSVANVQVFRNDGSGEVEHLSLVLEGAELRVIELPAQSVPAEGTSLGYYAWRILSDSPVVAYQFNPLDNESLGFSADASLLLPAHAADTYYVAVTSKHTAGRVDAEFYDWPAFVAVVAIGEGPTEVTLAPSTELADGPGGSGSAARTLTLQPYQVWTVATDAIRHQLTGTVVSADQPVLVFSGSTAAIVPNISASENRCCADHTEEQVLPRSTWGRTYAGTASRVRMSDGSAEPTFWTLVGGLDATTLSWTPSKPASAPETIDAGQVVQFRHDGDFVLQASEPVQVVQTLCSALWTTRIEGREDGGPGSQIGDPSMINIPPVEQYTDTYTVPIPPGFLEDYLVAILPGDVSLTLDGNPVTSAMSEDIGDSDGVTYRQMIIQVEDGTHVLRGSSPFGLIVTGFDLSVSYGFPAGLGLEPIFLI